MTKNREIERERGDEKKKPLGFTKDFNSNTVITFLLKQLSLSGKMTKKNASVSFNNTYFFPTHKHRLTIMMHRAM